MTLKEYEAEQKAAKDNSWCMDCHTVIDPDKEHRKKEVAQYLRESASESSPEAFENFFTCFDCTIRQHIQELVQMTDFMNSNPPKDRITPGQEELTTAYAGTIRNQYGQNLFDVTAEQTSNLYYPDVGTLKTSATILVYGNMDGEGPRYLDIAITELTKFTEDETKIKIYSTIANARFQNIY